MKIRLALTLDVHRDPKPEPTIHETQLDSLVEHADGNPPIGFRPNTLDPEDGER